MSKLLIVGTVAFDAIETPFGKTDKILGGAGTFIGLSASFIDENCFSKPETFSDEFFISFCIPTIVTFKSVTAPLKASNYLS